MRAGAEPAWHAESDRALLEAITRERSARAFQELFGRYAPRLKGYFMRGGQSAAQAEDLVQDVLISVWHHADGYQPERAAVSTWLFRIARNRFIDVVRRERYVELEPEQEEDAKDGAPQLPDDALAEQQLSSRVAVALSGLSEEQAEVIRGSYYAHESATQIAARLHIPVGTVKSRMRAALGYLQQHLLDEGER